MMPVQVRGSKLLPRRTISRQGDPDSSATRAAVPLFTTGELMRSIGGEIGTVNV
jgi:hypothetical protein